MEKLTFNEWLQKLGYVWTGEEEIVKGYMTRSEVEVLIAIYFSEGRLAHGV